MDIEIQNVTIVNKKANKIQGFCNLKKYCNKGKFNLFQNIQAMISSKGLKVIHAWSKNQTIPIDVKLNSIK